jgi:hypothetical protein
MISTPVEMVMFIAKATMAGKTITTETGMMSVEASVQIKWIARRLREVWGTSDTVAHNPLTEAVLPCLAVEVGAADVVNHRIGR